MYLLGLSLFHTVSHLDADAASRLAQVGEYTTVMSD